MAALNAFEDVVVGNSALATVQFILNPAQDVTGAYVTYELLDDEGKVYSSGNGSTVNVIQKTNARLVQSGITIPVPATLPVNVVGTTYQVRLKLHLANNLNVDLYSNLAVLPATLTLEGADDVVGLKSDQVDISIVINGGIPSVINPLLYFDNELVPIATPLVTSGPTATSDGYFYETTIDTTDQYIYPSLIPYNILWQYILNSKNFTESSNAYIVTPSILQAVKDLMNEINKAKSNLHERPTFSVVDALTHLRLGGDLFNGYAQVTNFTFTNAKGSIRAYWLMFSKVSALRSQYMFEGESAFDFQGQAIQLTVDRAQYYEALAAAIEAQIADAAKGFKALLSKRGNISGDGSADPTKLRTGAMGSVGVTLSPVSRLRPWNPNSWLGGQRSIF